MGGERPEYTPPQTSIQHSTWGTALALTVTALVLVGCSRTPPDSQQHPGMAPATSASAADAQDVCARFAEMALGVDTVIDHSPADARHRAADQFGTSALTSQLTGQGTDATWSTLAAHRAHVVVTTTPDDDDTPPLTGNRAGAGVIATLAAVGSDGWRQPLPSDVVFCTLSQTSTGWKVAAVSISDTDTSTTPPTTGAP